MRTRKLDPFGLEVTGIRFEDLARRDGPALQERVARARVLVLRDQPDCDHAFLRTLKRLGEMMFTKGETAVAGLPDLNVVTNVGRSRRPRSVFHTDTSYVRRPPAFTALRAIDVPRSGGQTLFSDQVTALRSLPPHLRHWLSGRRLKHAYTAPGHETVASWHPLLRRHPLTGEAALYLSTPERCDELSDADCDVARRIISILYERSCRPSRLYRHSWRKGDIVIWDDRLTLHRADHSDVRGHRTFHRGMIRGEHPIAA